MRLVLHAQEAHNVVDEEHAAQLGQSIASSPIFHRVDDSGEDGPTDLADGPYVSDGCLYHCDGEMQPRGLAEQALSPQEVGNQ